MDELDKEWVVQALLEAERRQCASRVLSVESEDGAEKGDSYNSDIKRIKVKVVLNSGSIEERSLIFKRQPTSEQRKILSQKMGTFIKETRIFTDVLPEMESIWRQVKNRDNFLWPEYYGSLRSYAGFLMEDLTVKSFKLADRLIGLDFEHSVLVLRSLARFHALAAVLKERGNLNVDDYDTFWVLKQPQVYDTLYKCLLTSLASVMETKWKGEWTHLADRMRKLSEIIGGEDVKAYTRDDTKFNTLCHGDCWLPNIMFHYNQDGKLDDLRFIDFQMVHYNNPCLDLQYFLQLSLDLKTRPRKMELLEIYHSSLENDLQLFGYSGKVPTMDDIKELYKSAGYTAVGVGLGIGAIAMAPKEYTGNIEKMAEKLNKGETPEVRLYEYEGETFLKKIQLVIKEAVADGLL